MPQVQLKDVQTKELFYQKKQNDYTKTNTF